MIDLEKKEIEIKEKCGIADFFRDLFGKKQGYVIFFSSLISILAVVIVVKSFVSYQEHNIDEIREFSQALDNRINDLRMEIAKIGESFGKSKDNVQIMKDSLPQIYTSLAAVQKDLSIIKNEFHINSEKNKDESVNNLNSEESDFIVAFENIIKEGTPFEAFLNAYDNKIDINKYGSTKELLRLKSENVKSILALKKDIIAEGRALFGPSINESFWEKQTRIVKEKIMSAITIKNPKDDSKVPEKTLDDQTLYKEAIGLISNEDIENALSKLKKIKLKHALLDNLLIDLNKRLELDNAFATFKEEFVGSRSKKS
ncbi:hypothetical protein FACS1894113_0030 [Alphaproteobacteria bacterium]|nr:hypothetical protein FACS1894113_0030 [Alphaproteobacteria bacterium]